MKRKIALILLIVFCFITTAIADSADRYDLNYYGYRDVITKGRGALVFQNSPRGSFMNNHKFNDGERIYVHLYWRENGYAMAYQNGEYGYVDASYINWGNSSGNTNAGKNNSSGNSSGKKVSFKGDVNVRTGPGISFGKLGSIKRGQTLSYAGETRYDDRGVAWYSVYFNGSKGWVSSKYSSLGGSSSGKSGSSSGKSSSKGNKTNDKRYDLDQYGYRRVTEKGRGALIFQKSPRGSFMKSFKFRDGDRIYVNLKWRQNGYAIAYKNGTYGYVDASYIEW